jgi:hypothetical protein
MKVNTAGLFSLAHVAPTQAVDDGPPPPPVRADGPTEVAPRVRKTTLDNFNEEMSVLDRPMEVEVEFYDEPRPRRWRVPAIGAAIFVLSCGAYLGLLRHRRAAEAASAATVPAAAPAPVVASAPSVPSAATTAAMPPPAAAAPATPAPAPVVADRSDARAHHHHHARHGGQHHHRGGHGRHARG